MEGICIFDMITPSTSQAIVSSSICKWRGGQVPSSSQVRRCALAEYLREQSLSRGRHPQFGVRYDKPALVEASCLLRLVLGGNIPEDFGVVLDVKAGVLLVEAFVVDLQTASFKYGCEFSADIRRAFWRYVACIGFGDGRFR